MVTKSALRGYLLEEAPAWLLRSSGYRLLTNAKQDKFELINDGDTLRVRGRGATHQVDVLGELVWTPAFSLPVRLFLEAKFRSTKAGIEVVRNAHGVIHDINENFAVTGGTRPRRRYRYTYCLFSTRGFGPGAANYALAHQISLVDLSGDAFLWLRQRSPSQLRRSYRAPRTTSCRSSPSSGRAAWSADRWAPQSLLTR